jgi:hypothetical protein
MPLHVHLLDKCNHMYKYVKIVLTFPVHTKTQSGGWYNSVYTIHKSINRTLNIKQNYFVNAETYQNCK